MGVDDLRNVQFIRLNVFVHNHNPKRIMEKLTPEKAVKILRKHGTDITIQEAEQILEFLRMLADIQVAQWLRKQKE